MQSRYEQLSARFEMLKAQRSTWEPLWKRIRDYVAPDSGRFDSDRRDRGYNRYSKIIDATAVDALDTLAAGMQSGISSPARQWFKLTTNDPKLDESIEVKQFLEDTQRSMQMLFARSDVYRALHSTYFEMGAFGVGATLMTHGDKPGTIDCIPLTIGEFWLAEDFRGRIDTLYRQFKMTAIQMIRQWGEEAVSQAVKEAYHQGRYYDEFDVIHAIEPREKYDPEKSDALNMPWASIYFEPGNLDKRVLSESGFRTFPAMCPRWRTVQGDVYGRGPGAKAVSTSRALQQKQYRYAEAVDLKTKPPLLLPLSMKGRDSATLPGARLYYSDAAGAQGIKSAYEVNTPLQELSLGIEANQNSLRRYFYADMFQVLTDNMRANRTAFEIEQIVQEKMMVMGPVLESLHTEMLDPLINMAFNVLLDDGLLPTPPSELRGRDLNVEYVSVMAQAQRNSGMQAVAKFMNYAQNLGTLQPQSLDLLNGDTVLREIADIEGVPADFLRTDDEAKQIRDQRAQMSAQQMQVAQAKEAAGAMRDASQASALARSAQ